MAISINEAWNILFEKHKILTKVHRDGMFSISSKEINMVKEARLMAKFDQSSVLPTIFKDNELSILPTQRGQYAIGQFSTYQKISYGHTKPILISDPMLETLEYTNLYSESAALLFAYNSGIIADFLEATTVNFTVNGRMSSGCFDYDIRDALCASSRHRISVSNAQIEIDAGYETPDLFCVCEAKNIASEEILIRQLYYPYRLWSHKLKKPVIPVFMAYSNDVFYFFRYIFEDQNNYNSLVLQEQKSYRVADENIYVSEIADLCFGMTTCFEPDITFPQANSFARVVDLLSVLYDKELTRDEVALKYGFVERQTNYYISACDYLGLIERDKNDKNERVYRLNAKAKRIMSLRYKKKYLELFRCVLQRPVFHKILTQTLRTGEIPSKNEICDLMKRSNLKINDTTIDRRHSTVIEWIVWMLDLAIAD